VKCYSSKLSATRYAYGRLVAGCFQGLLWPNAATRCWAEALQSEIDRAAMPCSFRASCLLWAQLAACLGQATQIEKGLETVDEALAGLRSQA